MVTIELHSLTREARKGYSGPYQGDVKLSAEDISAVTEGESMGFSTVMDTLRTLSRNVSELATQVERLREQFEQAQKQNEKQFELFQKQHQDIRWWLGWAVGFISLMVVLSNVFR